MLKITKLKLFFCLSTILFSSNLITAQASTPEPKELLKKIDHAIENLHTVVYKMHHRNKFLSRRDTITTTAVCSLYVNGNKMYNIVDGVFTELGTSTYGFRKYDGKKCLWMNWKTDSLDVTNKPDVISKKHKVEAVVENYKSLLLSQYVMQKQPFGKYEAMAGNIGIEEKELNNVPVYVLTFKFKDHEDIRDNVEKHYIRKSDYLPVAYSSFLRWENMEQYIYYEVEYIAINPNINISQFTIQKNETVNARERYTLMMQQ